MEDIQMNTKLAAITALSLLLAVGTASPSWAQTEGEHEAHHPEASEVVPDAGETGVPDTSPGGMTRGMMPGMMMGGNMQGMQGMPGLMGMTGIGQGGTMGMCPMMQGMMQGQGMMGQGMMGQRMKGSLGAGQGAWLYGIPGRRPEETTPETARSWLERQLEQHGNPRLRIGSVERQADGTVIATVETVDGSLVQRLTFNRYPGFVRQAD
jgi:hypothetical protein